MCDRVAFTATGSRARCVSGPCHMRPNAVSCVWERSGIANCLWKCSANLGSLYELVDATVTCYDTSRCEGSTCSVDYGLARVRTYETPHGPSSNWDAVFVTIVLIVAIVWMFSTIVDCLRYVTSDEPRRRSYYAEPAYAWYSPYSWYPPYRSYAPPPTHESRTYADGPSFAESSASTQESTSSTYARGPDFTAPRGRRTTTTTASGPSFG